MIRVLIIEKNESGNTEDLLELLGENAKLELFLERSVDEILRANDNIKDTLETIVFHASGRHGVAEDEAIRHVRRIMEWKSKETQLVAVSEGESFRNDMKKAGADMVRSYNFWLAGIKRELKS